MGRQRLCARLWRLPAARRPRCRSSSATAASFSGRSAIFAAASIAGGFVDSGPTLIAARLIKGIAAAFTAPAALALLLSVFGEGSARAKALGVFSSTGAAGFVLGMVLGGAATIISWRATLVMGAPVAILALVVAPFVLPADHEAERARAPASTGPAP